MGLLINNFQALFISEMKSSAVLSKMLAQTVRKLVGKAQNSTFFGRSIHDNFPLIRYTLGRVITISVWVDIWSIKTNPKRLIINISPRSLLRLGLARFQWVDHCFIQQHRFDRLGQWFLFEMFYIEISLHQECLLLPFCVLAPRQLLWKVESRRGISQDLGYGK